MIIGRNFAEKLYSANEYYEDEKLYSTGDDYLDDLLEKAFCDGYEYAQKEFAAYKSPISQKQARELVKEANVAGIKGNSVGVIAKNALRKGASQLGGWDNLRQGMEGVKSIRMKNPTGGNPKMAQRANKATLYVLKKGLK
jgi:hypothetical protein